MKRTFIILSAVISTALFATQANAQYPAQTEPPPMAGQVFGGMPAGMPGPSMQSGVQGPSQAEVDAYQKRYGVHPFIAKLFGKGKGGCSSCASCGKHAKPAPMPPVPLPVANGGTLAFPHYQYVRGPRDFFMYGERGSPWGE